MPAIEGSVHLTLDSGLDLPSNPPSPSGAAVSALSKTPGKPYYREAVANPTFVFTDLPFEAEIEITATKTGWDRGVVTVMTGVQADRKAISIGMKRVYYAY